MHKCEYPECTEASKKTWGLVPLCAFHYQLILEETHIYYKAPNKKLYEYRLHYLKIAPQISWSRDN